VDALYGTNRDRVDREALETACALQARRHTSGTPREENETPTSPRRATVLVVDDEPDLGRALARILREHDVTVVTKAEEALALLAAGKHFDVILSDLMMPEMSGMALYQELTRRYPDAARRVAFVTGGAFSPEMSAFLDRIPNEHVTKPIDVQSVRSLVRRVLDDSRIAGD